MACVLGLGQQRSGTWGQGGPDAGGRPWLKGHRKPGVNPLLKPMSMGCEPNSATPTGPPRDGEPHGLTLCASCPECPKLNLMPAGLVSLPLQELQPQLKEGLP